MAVTKKDLWRLRANWVFIMLVAPLYSISLYGVSSSFHQFITNPTAENLVNRSQFEGYIEPGLGKSELFYSLLVSVTYFGAAIGGILSGFLTRSIPYWYLWMISLVSHTISYIIYCLGNQGWLIMVSRLMAGYFIGAVMTLAFNYNTTSSETYVELKRELGMEVGDKESSRLRNQLYAFVSIGYSIGLILGSGSTAIFALFPYVDQFRSIGWLNVGYGVAAIILQVLMFHGEMNCGNYEEFLHPCPRSKKDTESQDKLGVFAVFIILSLLVLSLVERLRFAFVQTLFNPIASDSFGIDERGMALFFLALSVPQVLGSITLVVLQRLHVSSQSILLLAICTTMIGYAVVTDWQTIPYDPCTEYSPYHNPKLVEQFNHTSEEGLMKDGGHLMRDTRGIYENPLTDLSIRFDIEVDLGDGNVITVESDLATKFSCEPVSSCRTGIPFLRFNIDKNMVANSDPGPYSHKESYECISKFSLSNPVSHCVYIVREDEPAMVRIQNDYPTLATTEQVVVQAIQILPVNLYFIARNNCIEAKVTGGHCQWTPTSSVTKAECVDCPPICRGVKRTLTFAQYVIGNSLLVFSSALQIVPVVSLLMNQSTEQLQGIIIGCMTAINAIARTVAPLLLDAGYERMQKRAFVMTVILALMHVPFIIQIMILFPKLGPKTKKNGYSKIQEDKDDSDTEIETDN